MFFPIVQGSAGGGALVLSVGTTTDYNILTAATAAGYSNGSGVPITVNVRDRDWETTLL